MYPTISQDPVIQNRYEAMRRDGQSHAIAEMLATQQAPQLVTDSVFLRGHVNGSQFEKRPELGNHYAGIARAHGVDPKGKVYLSGLAEYPGDPRAWVDGRGDVKRVCEERGYTCRGLVNHTDRQDAPDEKPYRVADDIVTAEADAVIAERPELASRREDVVEQVRAKRSPNYGTKDPIPV